MGKTSKTSPPDIYARRFHARDKAGLRILPRVICRKPRHGDVHPLSAEDVRNVLHMVPPSYVYGVRTVELRARTRAVGEPFGLYQIDEKRVRLYSCPPSTWVFEGAEPVIGRYFASWGATVTTDARFPTRIVIDWPDRRRLWDVYLDTLLHELGHHHTQYEASRPRPATRWRNEDLADLHAGKVHSHLKRQLAKRRSA